MTRSRLRCMPGLVTFLVITCLLGIFHLLYYRYFPTATGTLGHDYAYFLPRLLNGVYWFRANGPGSLPWFSPAFCAGLPFFPNPQDIYLSLPQGLALLMPPLQAVYLSIIMFALLGLVGMYRLLCRVYASGVAAAWLGAAVFLFNGFYISRMLIGHLTYQTFMLIPWLALLLIGTADDALKRRPSDEWMRVCGAGLLFAVMFYAGAANFMVPTAFALVGLYLLACIRAQGSERFWWRLVMAVVLSIMLAAVKLYPAMRWLSDIGRELYPLPGYDGGLTAIMQTFANLFWFPDTPVSERVVNFPFRLERHEFEFGVTPVPLMLIAGLFVYHWHRGDICLRVTNRRRAILIALLSGLIMVPVVLNIHTPTWSAWLNSLPYLRESTSLFRWTALLIPLLAVITALALASVDKARLRQGLALAGIALVILFQGVTDRTYYQGQDYNPALIQHAWQAPVPAITAVANLPGIQEDVLYPARNDLFITGQSQLQCYEPLYGYALENFPVSAVHRGSILEQTPDGYNLRNPACDLYPEENQCSAGAVFRAEQHEAMLTFSAWKPYEFTRPLAASLGLLTSISALLLTLAVMSRGCRRLFRKDGT